MRKREKTNCRRCIQRARRDAYGKHKAGNAGLAVKKGKENVRVF